MEYLIYILKIIMYFAIILITYKVLKNSKKDSMCTIILLTIILSSYSFISTAHPYVMDKRVYAIRFINDIYQTQVKNDSLGLYLIESLTHKFTYNADVLFFIVAFIYFFITLIAFKKAKAKPFALLLLLLSEYPFFGYYQLKQCLAIAFITLGLVEYDNKNKLKAYLYIVIACLFHEAALITIPLLIMLKGSNKRIIRTIEYLFFILSVLFFYPITNYIAKVFIKVVPFLQEQLTIYLNETGNFKTSINLLTMLKGIPFYIIAGVALFKRNKLSKKINNYDRYLTITIFISLTIVLSTYMYWFFRFGTFYYLFAFILATHLLDDMKESKDKLLFVLLTAGTFLALSIKLWIQYYFIYGGI